MLSAIWGLPKGSAFQFPPRNLILGALALFIALVTLPAAAQTTISTLAGGGPTAPAALSADISWPTSVALDKSGNLYVVAMGLSEVLKIDSSGNVTVVVGTGLNGFSGDGGPSKNAALALAGIFIGVGPSIALDASGNLYISDVVNQRIRRVNVSTGVISTVAGNGTAAYTGDGGLATSASLSFPQGIALDSAGNLFIADSSNNVVRRVNAATGVITTVAGSFNLGGTYSGDGGPATSAGLSAPGGVALDGAGNLFIADMGNNVIRRVDAVTGVITTAAGNFNSGGRFSGDGGPATSAGLNAPNSLAFDASGNLFIVDAANEAIRRVDAKTGIISTIAGTGSGLEGFSGDGGPATNANLNLVVAFSFVSATDVAVDASGNIFIPDTFNSRVRRIDAATGNISTFAGGGSGGDGGAALNAVLAFPVALKLDSSGNLFIGQRDDGRVRKLNTSSGQITTVAGNGILSATDNIADGSAATSVSLASPIGLAFDGSGNLFIADSFHGRVRRVDSATGIITTVAGGGTGCPGSGPGDGGPATSACLGVVRTISLDSAGNLFLNDFRNCRIRRVDASTGIITTVAGNGTQSISPDGGLATSTPLDRPTCVTLDTAGNIFICDSGRVRRVDVATGIITRVAGVAPSVGEGTFGDFSDGIPATNASLVPWDAIVDSLGNIFIADNPAGGAGLPPQDPSNRIRRVDAFTGIITTVAGTGATGFSADGTPATSASFNVIHTLTLDNSGDLFFADSANYRVRKTTLPAFAGVMPAALSFSGQIINTTSAAQTITVKNTSVASLSSISITPSGSTDFGVRNTCGTSLNSGKSCTIGVTFAPTATGNAAGTITITDNAPDSPQSVPLTGNGTDFSLGAASGASTSATVTAGQMATYNLQVNPVSGFSATVNLACSGAPTGAVCSTSPGSPAVSGAAATPFTVTVTTSRRGITFPRAPRSLPPSFPRLAPIALAWLLLLLLVFIRCNTSHTAWLGGKARTALVAVAICLVLFGAGCGGGSSGSTGTPAGTYTITVSGNTSGASGAATRTLSLTLTVN